MDYEKAYDEALERFKAFKKKYYTKSTYLGDMLFDKTGEMQKDFEEIFPQLRESEDERIMKELIFFLKEEIPQCSIKEHADKLKEFVPYLEKQKEQKPELVQQPPITYTYNSNASRDERLKAALLALLNSDLLKVKDGGYFTKQDLIEWVERIPTDNSVAWSEEDEEIIDRICANLEYLVKEAGSDSKLKEKLEERIKWMKRLKSLRPSWKPSKEQMEALKDAKMRMFLDGWGLCPLLQSLINELESL